jgi:PAS domain S-box-containing protein
MSASPVAQESERYRRILDSLADMVFCKSRSLQVTFANRAAQQYYGMSEDELRGAIDVPFNEPDFTQQYLRDDRSVFETGQPIVRPEEPNVARDGTVRYFHTVKTPIVDEHGRVVEIVGVSRDVTELRHEREQVLRDRAHLELALAAAELGTWEWDIVRNRVTWSAREEELYGLRPGTFGGTVEEYRSLIHPDDVEPSWQAVATALEQKAQYHHVVHRIVRPDGEVRWLDSHARFVYADDGEPLRLVGVSADVTERMESHEALRREAGSVDVARRELLRILEQAPAMISITQMPEGRVTFQNALSRAMLGGRDITGMTAREVFPDEEQLTPFLLIQEQVYRTGQSYVGHQMPVRLDLDGDGVPEGRYFNLAYHALRNAEGLTDAVMSFAVEVTEQVIAQQALEARAQELAAMARALADSNRDLDQFAYVASHDLKAPLRGIANLAQWIEEDAGQSLPEKCRGHLALLKGRVHRMESLIEGILMYSRAGRPGEPPKPVDVAKLVREVVELLDPPSSAKIEVAADLPTLNTQRTPLQQVFMNLVSNALRHARRTDPVVRINWRKVNGVPEFSVSDNGQGIAPEFHERIWGIFQTLEARDDLEGTGIGLAVVRKLVESRGGNVSLQSAPGAGATFRFTWPAATPSQDTP